MLLVSLIVVGLITLFIVFVCWPSKYPVQLSLPLLCPRCNGGPQGDFDCWWCGGIGIVSQYSRRRGY